MPVILDGVAAASEIKERIGQEVRTLVSAGVQPGLAIVGMGDDPASMVYARSKIKACAALGIQAEVCSLPPSASTGELLAAIRVLNQRDEIDGIIVELPLPKHIDRDAVLMTLDPKKDVDGFHPTNVGLLVTRRPGPVPCTAAGIMELLKRGRIPIEGAEAVVLGRSDIVGKPTAMLLLHSHATVTLCHTRTRQLPAVCRRADILIVAAGKPALVTPEFVKPGAVVVDVGIHRVTDPALFQQFFGGNKEREQEFARKGSVLIGDVHPAAAELAGAITPVPGGVGPLTTAMLMANTVAACRLRRAPMGLCHAEGCASVRGVAPKC